MTESSKTTEHTITIDGFRYQGEGTYTVRCSCGATFEGIAYHADAKRIGAAHVAQAKAAVL